MHSCTQLLALWWSGATLNWRIQNAAAACACQFIESDAGARLAVPGVTQVLTSKYKRRLG